MIGFIGKPQFRRLALSAAMKIMHLNIARISFFVATIFGVCMYVHVNYLICIFMNIYENLKLALQICFDLNLCHSSTKQNLNAF